MSELDDELRFHLEERIREFVAKGHSRPDAERLARARLGDTAELTEFCMQLDTRRSVGQRVLEWVSDLRLDVRHGARHLWRSRMTPLAVVLTLGLGIGSTTATYAVVDALLLNPLPGGGDRVVRLARTNVDRTFSISVTTDIANAWRAGVPSLEDVAMYSTREVVADLGAGREALEVGLMSANLLDVLGFSPAVGRSIAPGEVDVAVIDHGVWLRRFGGTTDVLERSVVVDDVSYRIVGVLPRSFVVPFASSPQFPVWVSLPRDLARVIPTAIGRVRPGTDRQALLRELDTVLASVQGEQSAEWVSAASSAQDDLGRSTTESLQVLFGAVALVLLAGCANAANLLLARAQGRQREFLIRRSLGAGRGRLFRQSLAECGILALTGWAVGLGVAMGCLALARGFRPPGLSSLSALELQPRVILASAAIALLTTVLFGVGPATFAAGRRLASDLRRHTGQITGDRRAGRWRGALVAVEVALCCVLLVGGGLLVRTLVAMQHAPVGFDPERLHSATFILPGNRYPTAEARRQVFQQLLPRITAIPGVEQATWALSAPPGFGGTVGELQVEGQAAGGRTFLGVNLVTPEYFAVTGTRIVEGQLFDPARDDAGSVLISQSLANLAWPGQSALGKRYKVGRGSWSTVVGVVGEVTLPRPGGRGRTVERLTYSPLNYSLNEAAVVFRVAPATQPLYPSLVAVAAEVDPAIKVRPVEAASDVLERTQALPRFLAVVLTAFSVVAIVMAAIGLYGVIAHTVVRRWREMGIRRALGAGTAAVLAPVVREAVLLIAVGVVVGLLASAGATRALRGLLFNVSPLDTASFVAAASLLALVATGAVAIPARRAARIDPARVLRDE